MSGESRLTVFSETSDGIQTVYPIRFALGYLSRSNVYVYQGDHGEYQNQIAYSWVDKDNIELSHPLAAGEEFWIRRVVNRNDLDYYFQSASLNPRALDQLHLQLLMLNQELIDGFNRLDGRLEVFNDFDMRGYKVINLAAGTEKQHAINKGQLDTLEKHVTTKVDKVDGKQLTTNDYSNVDRDLVSLIPEIGVRVNLVEGRALTNTGRIEALEEYLPEDLVSNVTYLTVNAVLGDKYMLGPVFNDMDTYDEMLGRVYSGTATTEETEYVDKINIQLGVIHG